MDQHLKLVFFSKSELIPLETRDELKTFIPRGNDLHVFEDYLETGNSHCETSHTVEFLKSQNLQSLFLKPQVLSLIKLVKYVMKLIRQKQVI